MLRIKLTVLICIAIGAFITSAISDICYANTYTVPVTIKCSESAEQARWKTVTGDQKTQYTLIADKMKINKKYGVLQQMLLDQQRREGIRYEKTIAIDDIVTEFSKHYDEHGFHISKEKFEKVIRSCASGEAGPIESEKDFTEIAAKEIAAAESQPLAEIRDQQSIAIKLEREGLKEKRPEEKNKRLAQVTAMCVAAGQKPAGRETTIYSLPQGAIPSSLVCPKGYGVAMKFSLPNSDKPEDYIFHADLIVTVDDEDETVAIKKPLSVRAEVKSPTAARTRAPAPTPTSFLESAIGAATASGGFRHGH